jgi:hypothetical protein|tara:strand:- start:4409 stop:4570 length:162 start_codon:yes stop_codon:yes gene_type:complete
MVRVVQLLVVIVSMASRLAILERGGYFDSVTVRVVHRLASRWWWWLWWPWGVV